MCVAYPYAGLGGYIVQPTYTSSINVRKLITVYWYLS